MIAPETMPAGSAADVLVIDGVVKPGPADGKWRKLYGADSSKGKEGGLCVGITNTGALEGWVDDGQGIRIATIGLMAGKASFFSMRLADGLTAEVDDKEAAVTLPNGHVPFDGVAYVGAGVYDHKKCDPIDQPPGAELLQAQNLPHQGSRCSKRPDRR